MDQTLHPDGASPRSWLGAARRLVVTGVVVSAAILFVGFYCILLLQTLDCGGTAGAALWRHQCDYDDGGGIRGAFAFSWTGTLVIDGLVTTALAIWCVRAGRRRMLALFSLFAYLLCVRAAFVLLILPLARPYVA